LAVKHLPLSQQTIPNFYNVPAPASSSGMRLAQKRTDFGTPLREKSLTPYTSRLSSIRKLAHGISSPAHS
jgi:hypothetical protein